MTKKPLKLSSGLSADHRKREIAMGTYGYARRTTPRTYVSVANSSPPSTNRQITKADSHRFCYACTWIHSFQAAWIHSPGRAFPREVTSHVISPAKRGASLLEIAGRNSRRNCDETLIWGSRCADLRRSESYRRKESPGRNYSRAIIRARYILMRK